MRLRPSRSGFLGKLEVWYVSIWTQPAFLCNHVDAIIVHGSSLKDQLSSKKVDPSKVYVIPHFDYGYLLQDQSNTNTNNDSSTTLRDYILVFGYIAPYKGIEVLIDAARLVWQSSKRSIDIVIAGSGDTSHIQKILTEEDRRHVLIRSEWIPTNQIYGLFKRSKFLVLPYIDASQSGVIPLSYTFSKPVIVSRAGSLPEFVDHGKTGFVFDINNSEQLADYILQLYEDERLCTDMGDKAFQKVFSQMSLEFCCKTLNGIYEGPLRIR